jgi:hypothetical protein
MVKVLQCPFGKGAKAATYIISLIFSGLGIYCTYEVVNSFEPTRYLFAILILIAAYLITFIQMPKEIIADDIEITIRLMGFNFRIPWQEVESIEKYDTKGLFQLFGTSGLFGFIGLYRKSGQTMLGIFSDTAKTYILRRKGKRPILFSAEELLQRPQ